MKTFCIGDIHGQYDKLLAVLTLANVDFKKDVVIQLGDIVDRGPEPFKCVDLLLNIKNIVFIRGNHDAEFINYLQTGIIPMGGQHGSRETIEKWLTLTPEEQLHYSYFFNVLQAPYYVDKQKRCFVHGGFNRHIPLEEQPEYVFYWDRDLFASAWTMQRFTYEDGRPYKFGMKQGFKEVYVGHSPTLMWGTDQPICACKKLWNLDTGSGKGGKLTIMDIDTKNYWQA